MELKEFIAATLTEIVEGVVKAQENTKELGVKISPDLVVNGRTASTMTGYKEIVKHSYLRNQANMERMDGDRQRLDRQMDQQTEQNKSTQDNINRVLDMLDKKL